VSLHQLARAAMFRVDRSLIDWVNSQQLKELVIHAIRPKYQIMILILGRHFDRPHA